MANTSTQPTPAEYTTTEHAIIQVFVGPERKRFDVHKALICAVSPFFECCVGNTNFKEGKSGEVFLPEDDACAFGVLVNWMYRNELKEINEDNRMTAIRAYVLADRLLMKKAQNLIMDEIKRYHAMEKVVFKQYENLEPNGLRRGLPLWQFYIDLTAYGPYWITKCILDHPITVLLDLVQVSDLKDAVRRGDKFAQAVVDEIKQRGEFLCNYGGDQEWPNPTKTPDCEYHDHDDGRKCGEE